MHRTRHILATCSLAALLGVPGLRAQQQQAQPAQQPSQQQPAQTQDQSAAPIPAYHSPLASQADNGENPAPADSGDVVPNDRALSGAQNLSLGSPETSRSYWQPHADVLATANTNAFGGTSGWTTYSSLFGGIDIHKIEGRSDTTLGVVGGAILSNDGGTNNYAISEVTFAERLTVRRFKFSFLDNMDYLPQAGLGYGGGFGLGLPGGGSLGLQPGLTPTDGILTTQGSRIDNSFLAESDVSLTRRSSLTLLGGYSLLDYLGNSLSQLNFHTVTGQAGYNRKLSAKDNVAVFYRFTAIRYNNVSQSINDNVVNVSYGRSVTGRLAFQLAAGPDYTTFSIPVLTSSTGTATSSSQLNWSASGSLTYQLRRASIAASYFHGVGAGSGVLAGSVTDTLTANFSRQLTRTISGGISGGYARNRALAIPGYGIFNESYDYTFAGANVSHPFGRRLSMYLSYQAQYQFANVSFCAGVTCGTSVLAHIISVGLHWQGRPMLF